MGFSYQGQFPDQYCQPPNTGEAPPTGTPGQLDFSQVSGVNTAWIVFV